MPLVTATTACCGSRPVANAFGAGWSITKMRGVGRPAVSATRLTMRYSSGASASVTGFAPANESAMRSLNHHAPKFMTIEMSNAGSTADGPKKMRAAAMRIRVSSVSSATTLMVFMSNPYANAVPIPLRGQFYDVSADVSLSRQVRTRKEHRNVEGCRDHVHVARRLRRRPKRWRGRSVRLVLQLGGCRSPHRRCPPHDVQGVGAERRAHS